jgi:hypothetical protein
MRQARALMTSSSPANSDPWSSSTLRPGRATRAAVRSVATGTARRISTVTRATRMSSCGSHRSIARASSAAGGPACCSAGSHGPLVASVERNASPSGR